MVATTLIISIRLQRILNGIYFLIKRRNKKITVNIKSGQDVGKSLDDNNNTAEDGGQGPAVGPSLSALYN